MMSDRPDWTRRPAADEHAPYYGRYLALVADGDLLRTLEHEGAAQIERIRAIPVELEEHRYASGKWSVRDMIGHVIDGERVFTYRALAFARGDANPLPGFEEEEWASTSNAGARSLAELCDDWEVVRDATVRLLRSLDGAALDRRGTASNAVVSVRALAWIIAGHAAHHLAVLEERYLS